jgi:hypothetical protein
MVRDASVTFSPARVSTRASAALNPVPAPTIRALLNREVIVGHFTPFGKRVNTTPS